MTPLESMRVVAGHFNALGVPYAFLGAAVLPLLLDDPELSEIRPTKDVDLTVKVVTLGELYQLEEKLRAAGFRNDTRKGAPICRWIVSDITVDVMPTEASVLGMSAEWFGEALETASTKILGAGVRAPVINPPCFLATKLAAFRDRGSKDLYMSKDLEDILTLLDGSAFPRRKLRGPRTRHASGKPRFRGRAAGLFPHGRGLPRPHAGGHRSPGPTRRAARQDLKNRPA